jgi:DNA-binding NarL/FixJ family response regulator
MARVLIVDDHPAVRTGLVRAFQVEPGVVPVGTAGGVREALVEAARTRPDVAVVDFHLGDRNGMDLCRRMRESGDVGGAVVYSAFDGPALEMAAVIAGVGGVVGKASPLDELFDAIRVVVRGESALPPPAPQEVASFAARLEPVDRPILGMLLDGTPPHEVAATLGLDHDQLDDRLEAMLAAILPDPWPGQRDRLFDGLE